MGCCPLPAPLCLQVPRTPGARFILQWFYRQEAGGSQPPCVGSCQHPVTATCRPQQRSPEAPAQPLHGVNPHPNNRSNPSAGAVGAPGAEVPPRDFWQGSLSLGWSVSIPGGLVLAKGVAAKPRPSARSIPREEHCQAHTGNTPGQVPGACPAGTCHPPQQELRMLTLACRGSDNPEKAKLELSVALHCV